VWYSWNDDWLGTIHCIFCRHITVSVSVQCICGVLQDLCSISNRKHTSMFTLPRCMTLPICMWPVVLTHTQCSTSCDGLPPIMSQTFQYVTAVCLSPLESTKGPRIQVRESCQGHSSSWIPAVAHGVLRYVIRTHFLNWCVLFGILDNEQTA
jgi:hypothetical protein